MKEANKHIIAGWQTSTCGTTAKLKRFNGSRKTITTKKWLTYDYVSLQNMPNAKKKR